MMNKRLFFGVSATILILFLFISPVSAGLFGWLKNSITGNAVGNVDFNISVTGGSAPQILFVLNNSGENGPLTLLAGPQNKTFRINFSVSDADGGVNIDTTSARINLSRGGEAPRYNTTCTRYQIDGLYTNFTCNVTMSWYDDAGLWNISINISDVNGNKAINQTNTLTVGTLTGFSMGPGNLTFTAMAPGSKNSTDNAAGGILLNNTGNMPFALASIDVQAFSLQGETNTAQSIYSGNFSVSNSTGSNYECNLGLFASQMNTTSGQYANVTNASLQDGNFQFNNDTAQENLYVCILEVGAELGAQYYSTTGLGSWTIRASP